jgi:hypothetical protein
LPDGYASKLLSPIPYRTVGLLSLGPLLGALGLKLAVLPDAEALAKVRHRLPQRCPGFAGSLSDAGSCTAVPAE